MPESYALYIGGEWVEGANAALPNQNPSDLSDIIGYYDQASPEQVRQAIKVAKAGQKVWAESGLESRYSVLPDRVYHRRQTYFIQILFNV